MPGTPFTRAVILSVALAPSAMAQSTSCGISPSAPYQQSAPQPVSPTAPLLPQIPTTPPAQPYVATPMAPNTPSAPVKLPPAPSVPQFSTTPGTGGNMLIPTAPNGSAPSGQFSVSNGQIIGPDGKPFLIKGINVNAGQVDPGTILATFPGLNGVRLASTPSSDPAAIDAMVQGITSKGGVVLIEDHSSSGADGGNNVLTGAALKAETDWYAWLAAKYKSNPGVWFGTANEPDNPSNLGSIVAQERAIYDAVRGTGSNAMVALEMRGGFTNDMAQQSASTYADMKNVLWDTHVYGWISKYSTDPSAVFSAFGNQVANAQSVKSGDGKVPTIVGEYGPSTTGLGGNMDANGTETIKQVLQSNLGGFAWAWNAGDDALTDGSGKLTAFGQQVANSFAKK